jgi:Pentapeptide repeats (8 copies)
MPYNLLHARGETEVSAATVGTALAMAAAMVDRGHTVHPGLVAGTALAVPPYRYDEGSEAQGDHRHSHGAAGWADRRGALLTFWLNNRIYRLTQQGQITDRYTKAIEQLGQPELAMRLGGIYALERIAKDSERDHPTVVEVLSAFVREESRKQSAAQARQGMGQEAAQTDTPAPESERVAPPATDIQAALTVLGRLPHRPEIPRADLSEAHFPGARLDRADLSGAQLFRVNLSGAQLGQAHLSGAQLGQAHLSDAQLGQTHLSRAQLNGADLSKAYLGEADLSGADLGGANLSGASLGGADLRQTQRLTQRQLDAAWGDALTQLPAGLRRPASWATVAPPPPALGV